MVKKQKRIVAKMNNVQSCTRAFRFIRSGHGQASPSTAGVAHRQIRGGANTLLRLALFLARALLPFEQAVLRCKHKAHARSRRNYDKIFPGLLVRIWILMQAVVQRAALAGLRAEHVRATPAARAWSAATTKRVSTFASGTPGAPRDVNSLGAEKLTARHTQVRSKCAVSPTSLW